MYNFRQTLAIMGNIKRISEMKEAGLGDHTIAGIFNDHGMNIRASAVPELLELSLELSKKAIPKKEVKEAIRGYKEFCSQEAVSLEDGFLPA